MKRKSMQFDVIIVGAGPAGLSAAIRLMQLAQETGHALTVCVLEKGSEIGAHILSGTILEPRALDELIPDWKNRGAPLNTRVGKERFTLLSKQGSIALPVVPLMKNHDNYIISLSNLCRWLAEQAETMGAEIYPGFAAAEILYDKDGSVRGVITGDMGRSQDGSKKPNFEPGMELYATYTFFSEGCRGHLAKQLMEVFNLCTDCDPQTYGIGIKELWEIKPEKHRRGEILHTIGWPLNLDTYGGSFVYHLENNLISVGFVAGLDYANPYLSPYNEFQRFKTHPTIKPLLENGRRIAYGARALNEGGFQSIPHLTFPGGCLIGCDAGFLNVAKIKGTHTAMKSGMLAAEAAFEALTSEVPPLRINLQTKIERSWIWSELYKTRNLRPSFAKWGLWGGIIYSAIDTYLLAGMAPWTLHHSAADYEKLKPAKNMPKINYPQYDGIITFDRLTNVSFSATNHEKDQPCHLQLQDNNIPQNVNLAIYDGPEIRFCPAEVYEYVDDVPIGNKKLKINAQNCVHCKVCDIKDPTQNITWITPQGGEGPCYSNM